MIISRAEIESIVSAYRTAVVKRKGRATAGSGVTSSSDVLELSGETLNVGDLREAFASQPYYREAAVADLRQRIAEGKYYVPTDQIVEKILGRLIADAAAN
jgi:anti-sigma28 factor (negative regulator of flagellin synthesis)